MTPGPGPGRVPRRTPDGGQGPQRSRADRAREVQRASTIAFSCLFVVLGLVMIGVTASRGGGVGYLIGALFTALGAGRLRLALRRPAATAPDDSGPGRAGGGSGGA